MTREEAIEIIKIERECVERNTQNECDRDCINCDLLRADQEIFYAYDMAIEALKEPKVGGWIPVSERLPENYKEVLVQYEKTNSVKNRVVVFMSVGLINEHGEWCNADGSGFFYEEAIAWQPLPEPYKEGEQE